MSRPGGKICHHNRIVRGDENRLSPKGLSEVAQVHTDRFQFQHINVLCALLRHPDPLARLALQMGLPTL